MIRFTLLINLLMFVFVGLSQEWEWVRQISGVANDNGHAVDTDEEGNVYLAGRSKFTLSFEDESEPISIPGYGDADAWVSKYDKHGNLLWAVLAGGSGYEQVNDVVDDGAGGCFITGFYDSEYAEFGEETFSPLGFRDGYVSHLNSEGDFLWTKSFGGTGDDIGFGLTLDNFNNLLFCGYVTDETEIDGEIYGVPGATHGYIGKLDYDGNLVDFHCFEPPYRSNVRSVVVDDEDNIYMCGELKRQFTFNGDFFTTGHSPSFYDAFVIKCDPDFNPLWFQSGGSNYSDLALDLDVSANGVYVCGTFSHIAVFDTITRSVGDDGVTAAEINGARNLFVASYDRNSGDIQWLLDGGFEDVDQMERVAVGHDGDIYFTGYFEDSIAILDTVLYSGGLNSTQIITGKVDTSGNLIWLRQSGNDDRNISLGLCTDKYDNVFVSGSFNSTISFDGIVINPQERDAFGGKLTQRPNPEYSLNGIEFCPGDTLIINLTGITSPLTYTFNSDDEHDFWMDSTTIYYLIGEGPEMSISGTVYAENNIYTDSVEIVESILVFDLPEDVLPDDSLNCNAFIYSIEDEFDEYDWNDGEVLSNEILIDSSGAYSLLLITGDGCKYRDTMEVVIPDEILLSLPVDTVSCDSLILEVDDSFISYSWNEGLDLDYEIRIESSGLYTVVVYDEYGCTGVDSVNVNILEIEPLNLTDTLFCGADNYTVDGDYASYNWNEGFDLDAEIDINESGIYTIFVTDENGCYGYDTMFVEVVYLNLELPKDTVLCDYLTYTILAPDGFDTYEWSNGDFGVTEIEVNESGDYSLIVSDEFGCEASDTIVVQFVNCLEVQENLIVEQKLKYSIENSTLHNLTDNPIEDIVIINLSGEQVMIIDVMNPHENIQLTSLSTGIYYAIFLDEKNYISRTKIMNVR